MAADRIAALEARLTAAQAIIDGRLQDFGVARRALRWMLEHRAVWNSGTRQLRQAGGGDLCVAPADDILVFIEQCVREIELGAESAG